MSRAESVHIFVTSLLSTCHTFLWGQCFLHENTKGVHTPASLGNGKKFTFTHPSAEGIQEHNFKEQQAHILAERGDKEELRRCL